MKTIIIDDNEDFAKRLMERLEGETALIACGDTHGSKEEIEGLVKDELDKAKTENESGNLRVIVNRELKSCDLRRQDCVGESILSNLAWRYDFPFLMYSFLPPRPDQVNQTIPLPSGAFRRLPSPSAQELLDLKISQCQDYIARAFPKMQHGFKAVSPAAVSVVRLAYGAVLATRIKRDDQFKRLDDILLQFYADETLATIGEFLEVLKRLVGLYKMKAGSQPSEVEASNADRSRSVSSQVVVVDDDAINIDGRSQWAAVLELMFKEYGISFSSILPSEIGSDASKKALMKASLILLDIDFSGDPQYGDNSQFGGLKLLKKFCQELPHIPVVMMSRYDEVSLYEECLRLGCYAYLTKDWGSYSRFRAKDSERKWFEEWDKAITTPLRFNPFFKDAAMLDRRGLLQPQEIEGLTEALKEIKAPKEHTAKSLASFFETFVVAYLSSRGEYTGQVLYDSVRKVEKNESGLRVGQLLHVMRNNIVHGLAHIDSFDSWLFLVLQRVFVLRCFKHSSLKDNAWTEATFDEFLRPFGRYDFTSDEFFFKNEEGKTSEINRLFLIRRNELLSEITKRSSLDYGEFQEQINAFIRCVAATFPRHFLAKRNAPLCEIGRSPTRKLIGLITARVTRRGKPFERGYEVFGSVWWLVECYSNLGGHTRNIQDYERKLLWFLAARCWTWYYGVLLGTPNEAMFLNALDEQNLSREIALTRADERLVDHFLRRNLTDYVPAYCLLVAMTSISNFTSERKSRLLDEIKRSPVPELTRREIQTVESAIEDVRGSISKRRAEKEEYEREQLDLTRGAAAKRVAEFLTGLESKIADSDKDIQQLNGRLEGLEDEKRLIERQINDRARLSDTLERVEDEEANPPSHMGRVEMLQSRIKAKFSTLRRVFNVQLDPEIWLAGAGKAKTYIEVRTAIDDLKTALNDATIERK
ncbi:MAG: hypothetical protein AABO57_23640 [Acidobacteriota bacterium]